MKTKYLLIPGLSLVAVTAWIVSRQRELDTLERQTAGLEQQVSAARSLSPSPAKSDTHPTNPPPAPISGGIIDWRTAASRLAKLEQGVSPAEMIEYEDFQEQLAAMTDSELLAAIHEIHGMELGKAATTHLEEALVEPLIEKNPKLALETFASRTFSDADGVGWYMSVALGDWAKTDTKAAAAWLDARIAEGMFDSKTLAGDSEARLEFEAALAESLLGGDSLEATRRIAALPEDQRLEVLEQLSFPDLDASAQQAYLTIMGGLIPVDEQTGALASLAEELVATGGYEAVDTFLKQAIATPQEREASASLAATSSIVEIADERPVTRADLEKMRTWLTGYAPESVDRMTGQAIAEAAQSGGEFDFASAAQLVRDYHQSSGNDQVVEEFLESFAASDDLDQALTLAELIQDRGIREKLISRLKSSTKP